MARQGSVHRPGCLHPWIEFDFPESAFVIADILLQNRCEGLGLLRTQVDALKVTHFYLIFCGLLHGAKDEKKVPDANPHLHAVGVRFTIVGSINEIKVRLRGSDHKEDSLNGNDDEGNWFGKIAL